MIPSKFGSFTLDLRRRPRSPGPGVEQSGGLGIIGEHWSLRRRKKSGEGQRTFWTTMGRRSATTTTTALENVGEEGRIGNGNGKVVVGWKNGIIDGDGGHKIHIPMARKKQKNGGRRREDEEEDEDEWERPKRNGGENVPPYASEKELLFNQSPIGSACLNSEKRNLDRSQFGGGGQLNWQSNKDGTKRGNGKEAKTIDNCGKRRSPKGIAGEGVEGGDGTNFDSPGVTLLACSSSSSAVQLASAPHRFATFLSRRLKRTKSQPKLPHQQQNDGRGCPMLGEHQQQHGQLAIRASLGPNALRTDQQQQQERNQPLSLYLPNGQFGSSMSPTEEQLLKSSRSFESLMFHAKAGHGYLQKSPSESDHRLLLCPAATAYPPGNSHSSQQFLYHPNHHQSLQSSMLWLDNNGVGPSAAGPQRCWMDSSASANSLRARMQPFSSSMGSSSRDDRRREENSLSVWVLEAKGIPAKRRFFCELSLDQVVKARTSAKALADGICFWGEQFDFQQLPPSKFLCIDLFREAEPQKKRRSGKSSHEDLQNLIGLVRIPIAELSGRQPTEKWYSITSGNGQSSGPTNGHSSGDGQHQQPSVRLKARYQSVQVLPLRAYHPLRDFLRANFLPLCATFEPILGVKAKEDFANCLVRILHAERRAPEALAQLAMAEVLEQENDHLLFRGNSLATKAVEAYMKLVANDYLQMALGDFVRQLVCSELSCEVDPLRLTSSSSSGATPSSSQLEKNRQQLMRQVEIGWRRILGCQEFFPFPLRLLFANLRQKLEEAERAELADNLLSSSIFLRFLCPAILSPSLFGLVREFPTGQAARNLTLIAKSLQTLANFTRFGGKEGYMEFMNGFVEREWRNMQQFLRQISAPCPRHCQTGELQAKAVDGQIDLGKELSLLNSYLHENWTSQLQEQQQQQLGQTPIGQLWGILVSISTWDLCDQPEEEEEDGDGMAQDWEGGKLEDEAMSHNSHNCPSDYENNAVQVGSISSSTRNSEERRKHHQNQHNQQQQQPIPCRRAILPPQPICTGANANAVPSANGTQIVMVNNVGSIPTIAPPPPLPLMPPPSFSPSSAANHLHSSDDYVLHSALNKLRIGQQQQQSQEEFINGHQRQQQQQQPPPKSSSSIIHLYDETPPTASSHPVHLYDEVANNGGGGTNRPGALRSGIVVIGPQQRGMAIKEAQQRRELCTPRIIQRGLRQQQNGLVAGERPNGRGGIIGADEADDEIESDEEETEKKNGPMEEEQRRMPIAGMVAAQASPRADSSSGSFRQPRRAPRKRSGHANQQQQHQNGTNFDSSSASANSNYCRPLGDCGAAVGVGIHHPMPSSGYQSQMNSSGSYSSASSSPIDITENSLLIASTDTTAAGNLNGQQRVYNPVVGICHQTSSVGSSSCSSSSAYSSLSPNQPQQPNGGLQQQQQQRSNANEEMNSTAAAMGMNGWPSATAQPRTNQSCWSIPGFSSSSTTAVANSGGHGHHIQPRHAFVGSTPDDPLGAFIRYPPTVPVNGLPQKFPTAAELQYWPNGKQQQKVLYPSSSVDLLPNGRHHQQQTTGKSDNNGWSNDERIGPINTTQQTLRELELIEAQRRQISELTRQNAALRRELDCVRANSQCSLPTISGGEQTASESI